MCRASGHSRRSGNAVSNRIMLHSLHVSNGTPQPAGCHFYPSHRQESARKNSARAKQIYNSNRLKNVLTLYGISYTFI